MTEMRQIAECPTDSNTSRSNHVECCAWCSLPVSSTAARPRSDADSESSVYCCFGCRMAHAITQEKGQEGAVRWTVVRLGIAIFFAMNLMAFTMTMWSLDVYEVQRDAFQMQLFEVFRWLSMIFALPVLLLLGVPLLQNAVDSWRQRIYSTDLLIAIGVIAAYLISAVNVVQGQEGVYFEVGATVLVMVTLGRWFEATGRQKATEALDRLAALLPTTARRVIGEQLADVPCGEIVPEDCLQICAGERFPVDAVLVDGVTTVDEQVFTGESAPVKKNAGDRVLAGTVNLDGHITVRATAVFRGGSFGKLLQLLQEARLSRGRYQRMADRVSAWFLPLITFIAMATLIAHWQFGAGLAIQHSLSVLLIACPCALGLATPLAVWTALSIAARHQVLFRSGESIERLASVEALCFDKTGTLTTGSPQVRHLCILDDHESSDVLPLCAALASTSTHPFSQAVVRFVSSSTDKGQGGQRQAELISRIRLSQVRSVAGGGVEALLGDGKSVRLGSLDFVTAGAEIPPRLRLRMAHALAIADQEAASVVGVSVAGRPAVLFLLTETMRAEASMAIRQCLDGDLPVTVLTGDRAAKAEQLRRNLLDCHEPGCQCNAECMATNSDVQNHEQRPVAPTRLIIECDLRPEQKVEHVLRIRDRDGIVAMVGDGINDAPALAASDVGIAMGCGADVSRDSAQVCLLSNDLSRIPWAILLARRTRSVIRQNLFWAFGYNSVGVILASMGLLNPAIAAGLMIFSSLLVITNSLRLMAEAPADVPGISDSGWAIVEAGDKPDSMSEPKIVWNHEQTAQTEVHATG
jgi:heavy metal translocating P-type ATPase